jgi:hypothetical protein
MSSNSENENEKSSVANSSLASSRSSTASVKQNWKGKRNEKEELMRQTLIDNYTRVLKFLEVVIAFYNLYQHKNFNTLELTKNVLENAKQKFQNINNITSNMSNKEIQNIVDKQKDKTITKVLTILNSNLKQKVHQLNTNPLFKNNMKFMNEFRKIKSNAYQKQKNTKKIKHVEKVIDKFIKEKTQALLKKTGKFQTKTQELIARKESEQDTKIKAKQARAEATEAKKLAKQAEKEAEIAQKKEQKLKKRQEMLNQKKYQKEQKLKKIANEKQEKHLAQMHAKNQKAKQKHARDLQKEAKKAEIDAKKREREHTKVKQETEKLLREAAKAQKQALQAAALKMNLTAEDLKTL